MAKLKPRKKNIMERLNDKRIQKEAKLIEDNNITLDQLVYRVEIDDPYGGSCGPYTARCFSPEMDRTVPNILFGVGGSPYMLEPEEDGISMFHRGMKCGTATAIDLTNWFNPFMLRDLVDIGFRIVRYRVSKVANGGSQVAWYPKDETVCELLTIDDIMSIIEDEIIGYENSVGSGGLNHRRLRKQCARI